MTETFRPMLASQFEKNKNVKWPLLASPKLDGIRCIVMNGKAMTRSMKPIRNKYIQLCFSKHSDILDNFDGEIVVGDPTAANVFNKTSSQVNSEDGEPDFKYWVFDKVGNNNFLLRFHNAGIQSTALPKFATILESTKIHSMEELNTYEERVVNLGYEGVMLRDPDSPYKQGRSTPKEGYLMKLKRFEDDEAIVLGVVEEMRNDNPTTINELGLSSRSSHQANFTAKGTLGKLQVRGISGDFKGVEFSIGSGFDKTQRKELWDFKENMVGKIITFKHFPIGVKDKPRMPIFKGFRDESDMNS